MNALQIELIRLLWRKELTFWCYILRGKNDCIYRLFSDDEISGYNLIEDLSWDSEGYYFWDIESFDKDEDEILGHKPELSDFHMWMNEKSPYGKAFDQDSDYIKFYYFDIRRIELLIKYDASKYLLNQDEETLKQIIALIKSK